MPEFRRRAAVGVESNKTQLEIQFLQILPALDRAGAGRPGDCDPGAGPGPAAAGPVGRGRETSGSAGDGMSKPYMPLPRIEAWVIPGIYAPQH
jgi:hypothetical protein